MLLKLNIYKNIGEISCKLSFAMNENENDMNSHFIINDEKLLFVNWRQYFDCTRIILNPQHLNALEIRDFKLFS